MHTISRAERPPGLPAEERPAALVSLLESAASLLRHALTWPERVRQRRVLMSLDDWVLKDIGLSRADIMREGDKPFWQA